MPEDSLLTDIGMGSTLPLNGIGTSPTFNSTNNCPLIALSHSLLLGALSCPATASSTSLARPWRPFFFSSRPQTPFPARDKLQYPRQRPIASSPSNQPDCRITPRLITSGTQGLKMSKSNPLAQLACPTSGPHLPGSRVLCLVILNSYA